MKSPCSVQELTFLNFQLISSVFQNLDINTIHIGMKHKEIMNFQVVEFEKTLA